MASQLVESFREYFQCIEDPRSRDSVHRLDEILFLAVCATIAGADGPSDIEQFGLDQIAWLQRFIPLSNGVPSHDTIGRVLSLIKPKQFQQAFLEWIASFKLADDDDGELKIVPIDGKKLSIASPSRITSPSS